MDISELSKYINAIVCGICFCLGLIIKNSLDFIPNRYIPAIMGIIGILLNIWMNGWNISPEIILIGIVSGLSSTGLNELIRNL